MSTKNEQLVRLIEVVVRRELKTLLPVIMPKVIKEVMAGMIMESVTELSEDDIQFTGNSEKRQKLVEQRSAMEEYPTMRYSRTDLVQADGLDLRRPAVAVPSDLNIPSKALSESGNHIPISPSAVPDFIIKAMNKNYSQDLQAVDRLTKTS